MKNKVVIKLLLPEFDLSFDLFIPVNEVIWKVKKLLIKAISDLTGIDMNINDNYLLINKESANLYENNEIVLNTDIRNGTEIIMIKQN